MTAAQSVVLPITARQDFESFQAVCDAWKLSSSDRSAVLGIPARTFYRWKEEPSVAHFSADQRARIEYVANIYLLLHSIFDGANAADQWVHQPNDPFGRRAPIDVLHAGSLLDFYGIYQYLRPLGV